MVSYRKVLALLVLAVFFTSVYGPVQVHAGSAENIQTDDDSIFVDSSVPNMVFNERNASFTYYFDDGKIMTLLLGTSVDTVMGILQQNGLNFLPSTAMNEKNVFLPAIQNYLFTLLFDDQQCLQEVLSLDDSPVTSNNITYANDLGDIKKSYGSKYIETLVDSNTAVYYYSFEKCSLGFSIMGDSINSVSMIWNGDKTYRPNSFNGWMSDNALEINDTKVKLGMKLSEVQNIYMNADIFFSDPIDETYRGRDVCAMYNFNVALRFDKSDLQLCEISLLTDKLHALKSLRIAATVELGKIYGSPTKKNTAPFLDNIFEYAYTTPYGWRIVTTEDNDELSTIQIIEIATWVD